MSDASCATYKIGCATVHVHGKVNQDTLKNATVEFLKNVECIRKKQQKEENIKKEKGA